MRDAALVVAACVAEQRFLGSAIAQGSASTNRHLPARLRRTTGSSLRSARPDRLDIRDEAVIHTQGVG
jgi:hypothetical protein